MTPLKIKNLVPFLFRGPHTKYSRFRFLIKCYTIFYWSTTHHLIIPMCGPQSDRRCNLIKLFFLCPMRKIPKFYQNCKRIDADSQFSFSFFFKKKYAINTQLILNTEWILNTIMNFCRTDAEYEIDSENGCRIIRNLDRLIESRDAKN